MEIWNHIRDTINSTDSWALVRSRESWFRNGIGKAQTDKPNSDDAIPNLHRQQRARQHAELAHFQPAVYPRSAEMMMRGNRTVIAVQILRVIS
jgi:hypothetical protein